VDIKEKYVAKRKEVAAANEKIAEEVQAIDAEVKKLAARKQELMTEAVGNNARLELLDELLKEARTQVKPVNAEKKGGAD
jgi:hypothetical protein